MNAAAASPSEATLHTLAAISPYFAVSAGPRPDAGTFRPLRDLYGTPELLADRVRDIAERLGTGETRVAASVLHLGIAARLWSVHLGAAAYGMAIDLTPDRLRWRLDRPGPVELWTGPEPLPSAAVAAHADAHTLYHAVV